MNCVCVCVRARVVLHHQVLDGRLLQKLLRRFQLIPICKSTTIKKKKLMINLEWHA